MTTTGTDDGEAGGVDELFRELVREHGQKGTAARLGVSHNTVRRSLKQGRPTRLLRGKLDAYLLRRDRDEKSLAVAGDTDHRQGEKGVEVVDGPKEAKDGSGIAALSEVNLPDLNQGQLESEHPELPLRKLVALLALKVERLERNLSSAQSGVSGQGAAASSAGEPVSDHAATAEGSAAGAATDAKGDEPATSGETSGGGPGGATLSDAAAWEAMRAIAAHDDELLRKWWDARIFEGAARTELERVIARERTLQAEVAIVWKRRNAARPGEAWNAIKQDGEWERRWRALSEVSRKRRRLVRRRRLRRLLSLGLWRW